MTEKRVSFDFSVKCSNGGGIQGQGFRLDIDGDSISDDALAAYIVKDLRLLMVGSVEILNKAVIEEPHKRSSRAEAATPGGETVADDAADLIDLSHTIENGMITYKGLPAPMICDHISHVQSRASYAPGTEFQIGRIDMVANTGTYIDTPYHRYSNGNDLSATPLPSLANLAGVVVRMTGVMHRAIDWMNFAAIDVRRRAVLVNTA